MRIESEEISEGLDSDEGAGDGIIFRDRILEKNLQGFPCAMARAEAFDHARPALFQMVSIDRLIF